MRFLTDENIPWSICKWLSESGHDTISASDLGVGDPDSRWLILAEVEKRIVLTADKDFGDLVFRDHLSTFGIVLLRLDDIPVPTWVIRL